MPATSMKTNFAGSLDLTKTTHQPALKVKQAQEHSFSRFSPELKKLYSIHQDDGRSAFGFDPSVSTGLVSKPVGT
jgi:hypothetical protein